MLNFLIEVGQCMINISYEIDMYQNRLNSPGLICSQNYSTICYYDPFTLFLCIKQVCYYSACEVEVTLLCLHIYVFCKISHFIPFLCEGKRKVCWNEMISEISSVVFEIFCHVCVSVYCHTCEPLISN